jgi:hypothetical protein
MRFHLGAIPNCRDFSPDAIWTPLREPTPWVFQFIAAPIGIVAATFLAWLWFIITPIRNATPTVSLPVFLLSFAGIIVVHELIHAVSHPMAGRSPHSILGFWPSRLLLYAHYEGELTRNHFVAILLMPFLTISIIPLIVAACIQATTAWFAVVSVLNALAACGDILGAGMVLFQIPASAIVRNQGWKTYWRERECVK